MEYAKDCALAVTAGYINAKLREEFYSFIDAANVDLKGFTDSFYKKICGGDLNSVLETLVYLKKETKVWFEITTLLIPGENDSEKEIEEETQWIVENLGKDIPLHFTAFHPDFKMRDIEKTPFNTLNKARDIALKNGINFVYTGNVHDERGSSTYCPSCKKKIIGRDWYVLSDWEINRNGECNFCKNKIEGHFEEFPGDWGAKRLPLHIGG